MVPGCMCAGHPVQDWGNVGGGGGPSQASSSSLLHLFLSPLSHSFALLLSPPSLNRGSSLAIRWGPLSVPHPPPSLASLSTTTRNHSIKAPRGPAAWLMLIKESIVVDPCCHPSHQVCCCYCKPLIVLHCAVLLAGCSFCSVPSNLQMLPGLPDNHDRSRWHSIIYASVI